MIWLIGCKGRLGQAIENELIANKLNVISTDKEIDITDADAIERFEKSIETAAYMPSELTHSERQIKWVINAAQSTNFLTEDEDALNKINYQGAVNVARLTRKIGAKLIHISSAFVFDGGAAQPYDEMAKKNPGNAFGKTKASGDDAVAKEMNQYYIFRSGLIYGGQTKEAFEEQLNNLAQNQTENFMINPVSVKNLSEIIVKMIKKSDSSKELFGPKSAPSYGIYNFCDSGAVDLNQFINFASNLLINNKKSEAASQNCQKKYLLNTEKISKALKIKMPDWKSSLEHYIKSL